MRRFWPVLLIGGGLFLLVCGLAYDVMFAGIPDQDPTPEMSTRYAHHARVASLIYRAGGGVFLFGILAGVIRVVARRLRPPIVS